ncbi:MAG: DNA polymerase III subunit alpha [candidate division WOR-3 bacterium]
MPTRKSTVSFVHLHNHSQYSLLDGASRVEDLAKLAASFGMPALAITDHGNMFGAIEFYRAAQEAGVKPIIGAELYVAPGDRRERKVHAEIPEASFHLTLLAQDETGYYNLMKLTTLGYLEGFYYRPRIDKELLGSYAKGLIALSGCLKGEVNYFLRRGEPERAMKAAAQYQEILGPDNFYLEVMRAGVPEQEQIIPGIIELSESLGIPIVATNDCHYLKPEDAKAHEVLVCIQTGKKLADSGRLKMTSDQFYFRSPQEMEHLFSDIPGAVERTKEVADRCNLLLDFSRVRLNLPRYQSPEGYADDFAYLKHLAQEGLKRRYSRVTPAIEERLEHELAVIRQMGFPGYFLIVRDIVKFARDRGIPVGPGRGSAAGCLVLYCLGITDIDPLRYGLLFERFLTPERVSLPDVDIDFSDTRRQEVIDYIRHRYGEDSVAQIITFGTMAARAVIRDVGRVLDVPIAEVDRLAKLIPQNLSLAEALASVAEFKTMVESKPEYQELLRIARKLEGLNRHASVHASAVVIAPRPLIELVPLYKTPELGLCTQYDMYSLETVGLLKLDVLGLRTLTVVEEAHRLIAESGRHFSVPEIPLDDRKTYELLQRGDTVGVFQLESAGMRDLCRRMLPESIEHIIALIALYRPGPMKLLDSFVARKAGNEKIDYEHSLLEPICRETYGILVYQEQVMQAARALAGYTLGKADILRRAMGKKDPAEMESQRSTFVEGCAKYNRIPADRADRIFNLLAKFAGYGFNKSHAAGYAYLSYVTAYIKANYPLEFIAATLTSELGDSKKLAKFIGEARRMGVTVLGPDVNASESNFAIEHGMVRFGLAGVRNLGQGASQKIVEERKRNGPYQSLVDFLIRNRGVVNRKATESLIKAGAFDWTGSNRAQLLSELELDMARASSEKLRFQERQADLFGFQVENKTAKIEKKLEMHDLLAYEKEAFGFYLSSHPLEPYRIEYEALHFCSTEQLEEKQDSEPVSIAGVITARRTKRSRNDQEYVVVTMEDFAGWVEVMAFSSLLEKCRENLQPEKLVIVQGRVRRRESGMPQVWAERVMPFALVSKFISAVAITLPRKMCDELELVKLRETLQRHPGNVPVYFRMPGEGATLEVLRVKDYQVAPGHELVTELVRLFGSGAVQLRGELPALEPRAGWKNSRKLPDRR